MFLGVNLAFLNGTWSAFRAQEWCVSPPELQNQRVRDRVRGFALFTH